MAKRKRRVTRHRGGALGDGLRAAINARLEELGVSRYRLAQSGAVPLAPKNLYRYLAGKCDTTAHVAHTIMTLLGLEVRSGTSAPIRDL